MWITINMISILQYNKEKQLNQYSKKHYIVIQLMEICQVV